MKYDFVKSPLNYTGGKYKLLNQIVPLFPKDTKIFVDLFGGGFNVGVNVDAEVIVYNEFDTNVFNIIKGIYDSEDNILDKIDMLINEYSLSKTNKEGYLTLREHWNKSENKSWEELYTLICYSFNHSIRFNSKGEFNIAFGKDRSEFNKTLRGNFIKFRERIKRNKTYFYNRSFEVLTSNPKVNKDYFFYADPPYLITTANYNENGGWDESMENCLYSELDRVNNLGGKFALSNVIEHKGKSNDILKEWMKKYNVHYLNYNYKNCNYQGKDTDKPTIEVLITNY